MSAKLFDFNIDTYTFEESIERAMELINGEEVAQVVTINPEMIEYATTNSNFAGIINNAEMVIPDGVGVKIALQINGVNTSRIPGIDFAKRLLEKSALNNIPVAIVGAKEDVISVAIKNLRNEIPNLDIVYYHNGYFNEDNTIYEDLRTHSPRLILVAMGSPRQEQFIYTAKMKLNPCLMVGIGGSLDVWSGNIKRAPKIFQILGLEWLYRTITQPERFKRIFPTLPLFVLKSIIYKFSK
jgi:N-acetylglucosaminyldiphosphoundecaprenol N-acetyl-beta-D-mannosaminyltransferase